MTNSNGNGPAIPLDFEGCKAWEEGYWYEGWGLTKREYFAGLAMQGILSNHGVHSDIAKWAVEQADSLLKELELGHE